MALSLETLNLLKENLINIKNNVEQEMSSIDSSIDRMTTKKTILVAQHQSILSQIEEVEQELLNI